MGAIPRWLTMSWPARSPVRVDSELCEDVHDARGRPHGRQEAIVGVVEVLALIGTRRDETR